MDSRAGEGAGLRSHDVSFHISESVRILYAKVDTMSSVLLDRIVKDCKGNKKPRWFRAGLLWGRDWIRSR